MAVTTSEPPANQEVLPPTRGGAESACNVKPLSDAAGTAASTPQNTSTATAEPLNRAPPSSTRASDRRKRRQRRKRETSTSEGVDRSLSGHQTSRKEEHSAATSTIQSVGVVQRALCDPDSLTPEQVDRLVRVVCGKAIDDDDSAETAAKFCASVIAIERLRSALKTAGKTAERAAPARMAALVACLRDELLTPDASAETRLTLLELLELRASGWKFSAQQQLYYAAHSGVFGAECDDELSPLPLPCRTAQ